jgi:hypothetical protein
MHWVEKKFRFDFSFPVKLQFLIYTQKDEMTLEYHGIGGGFLECLPLK